MQEVIFSTKKSGKTLKLYETIFSIFNESNSSEILLIYNVEQSVLNEIFEEIINFLNQTSKYFWEVDYEKKKLSGSKKESTGKIFQMFVNLITLDNFLKYSFSDTTTKFLPNIEYKQYIVLEDVDQFEQRDQAKFLNCATVLRNRYNCEKFYTYSFPNNIDMKDFPDFPIFNFFLSLQDTRLFYHIPNRINTGKEETLIL